MSHTTNALDQVRSRVHDANVVPEPTAPFLSVIVRTQGRRPGTLRDSLVTLAAQSDEDFEVIIVVHADDAAEIAATEALVADETPRLVDKTTVLHCTGGTLARPLNVGVAAARGQYVAFFDDDDLVLDQWVATFHHAAQLAPGRLVRAVVVDQPCREEKFNDGEFGLVADGGVADAYPHEFSLLEHTLGGTSPFHAFAFPRTCFTELGLGFTESVTVHEDWEFQTRAVQYLGVTSTTDVTAVYRRHHQGDTLATHPSAIRDVLFADLVRDRLSDEVFLIDGEELLSFRQRTKQAEEIWHQKNEVLAEVERAHAEITRLHQEIQQLRTVGGLLVRIRAKVRRSVGAVLRRFGVRSS